METAGIPVDIVPRPWSEGKKQDVLLAAIKRDPEVEQAFQEVSPLEALWKLPEASRNNF